MDNLIGVPRVPGQLHCGFGAKKRPDVCIIIPSKTKNCVMPHFLRLFRALRANYVCYRELYHY
jgi:hypothetical protein